MAKKRSHRRFIAKIPIAIVGGASIGLISAPVSGWESPLKRISEQRYEDAGKSLLLNYVGYNADQNAWQFQNARGFQGLLVGLGIHWVASKVGLNRMLGRMKLPISI